MSYSTAVLRRPPPPLSSSNMHLRNGLTVAIFLQNASNKKTRSRICSDQIFQAQVQKLRWCRILDGMLSSFCSSGEHPKDIEIGDGAVHGVRERELSKFVGPLRVLGWELGELLLTYFLCAKANSPSFFPELSKFGAELSEFLLLKRHSRNSVPLVFLWLAASEVDSSILWISLP